MPTGQDRPDVALVRRFISEVLNSGRLELIDELWAPDLAWHGGSLGDIHGREDYRRMLAASAAGAFSSMHLSVHDVVAVDGKVVVRFTTSGTQTGPFQTGPFRCVPASRKHAEWLGIAIFTITGTKISEAWFVEDLLGMLIQLDAIALPETA